MKPHFVKGKDRRCVRIRIISTITFGAEGTEGNASKPVGNHPPFTLSTIYFSIYWNVWWKYAKYVDGERCAAVDREKKVRAEDRGEEEREEREEKRWRELRSSTW
jgi:hypothetical protein